MGHSTLFESTLRSVTLVSRGKVRDLYAVGSDLLLMVASDRLSAFDVVLPTPIPDKGRVLTAMSQFWFQRSRRLVPNHLAGIPLDEVLSDPEDLAQARGRSLVVRRLQPLPVEAVVRGYLAGSGWKDYKATGAVCGIELPAGLLQAERLSEPLYTPSTKAAPGQHDENIRFEDTVRALGSELADAVRQVSLELYREAAAYAADRGIVIADTKLEFGLDASGALVLIDELLTPDSSRFWPAQGYQLGSSPPSFDKQYVRDYLESIGWDKRPPAPALPAEVVSKTAEKYRDALVRLTGLGL